MPKCYSDQEKDYIRRRLKEEAAKSLASNGIKHTTVDDLVKKVKIPKGTFYLFYSSKEQLLFEVILEQHEQMEHEMFRAVENMNLQTVNAEQLTDLLYRFYKMSADVPVFRLLNSDEIELLARKLPREMIEEHFGHDSEMVDKLLAVLPVKPGLDSEVLSAAFRTLFMISLRGKKKKTESREMH